MWQSILYVIPEQFIAGANQLAMIFGYGPDDGKTFEPPNFQDAAGNKYAARFIWMPVSVVYALKEPLERPSWDSGELIDMSEAERVVSALVFSEEVIEASPETVIVMAANEEAIKGMGLVKIPNPEPTTEE